jgi:murein L,D-transpeptidase YcbB/YkuD
VHFFQGFRRAAAVAVTAAGLSLIAVEPAAAQAARGAGAQASRAATPQRVGQTIADFYRARNGAPLWFSPGAGDAAQQLLNLLATARTDGFTPERYRLAAVQEAVARARSGKRRDVERADHMLSGAFVTYVNDLSRDTGLGIMYVDADLRPWPQSPLAVLLRTAAAPSLSDYVRRLGWMNPLYGELRQALISGKYADERQRQLLALNLDRARALPAGRQRYILVNAAEQRLYAYENGQVVDSMRVVVGKPKYPTPMMTAWVRFASLNPYWFVPPDLAAERIAPRVLKRGIKYLDELGYQVMTSWDENAQVIDPKTIDWQAVADGRLEVQIRQLPGPHNSMGRMKFMFPNEAGVYLHDNPERELFSEASRFYSGGCVRLEDAARLGRWMFGRDLVWEGAAAEEKVMLRDPVPVYITYLTAKPEGGTIAYYEDVYGRDAQRLAAMAANGSAVASVGR